MELPQTNENEQSQANTQITRTLELVELPNQIASDDVEPFTSPEQDSRTPARTGSISTTGSPQNENSSPTLIRPVVHDSPIQSNDASSNSFEPDHQKYEKTATLPSMLDEQSPQDYYYTDSNQCDDCNNHQDGDTTDTTVVSPSHPSPHGPIHGMGDMPPSSLEGSISFLSEEKSSDVPNTYLF